METLLTYILQVNLLLGLLYLGYYVLLRGLTFYQLNRVYFIVGTVYAFIYPFLDIKSWFTKRVESTYIPNFVELVDIGPTMEQVSGLSLLDMVAGIVVIGVIVVFFKFILQLVSLWRIHRHSGPATWQSYFFRDVLFPIVPFSFFNRIYVHQKQHKEVELQDIFEHEYVHVKGRHTFDILLFEIILVGCWYNPFVWLMRRAVRENLEFLTDHQVLNKGVDRQAYQYSLLHVTKQGTALGIGNQFNFKTLKKRIMMMNKKRSSKLEWSKYAFLLPILVVAGASFTVSKAESGIEKVVEKVKETEVISSSMRQDVNELLQESIVPNKTQTDTTKQEKEYPLLAPDFNIKDLEGKNFHYIIDGKLVTLNEFIAFPRTDIAAVDIYKDKTEIFKKIGKENSEGLFVMTSKKIDLKKVTKVPFDELPIQDKPLIVVDDKVQEATFDMKSMDPNTIHSVTVLKDKSATALYGDKGKNGVVVIVTKPFNEANVEYNDNIKGSIRLNKKSLEGVQVKVNDKDNLKFGNKNSNAKPLFVVDGVVKGTDQSAIGSINPNDIESINVLKDKVAVEKYGEEAKDGVIEITTKNSDQKVVVVTGFKADSAKLKPEVKTVVGRARSGAHSQVSDSKVIDQVTVVAYSDIASDDKQPQPTNGMMEFRKWIGTNYSYPSEAIKAGVKGTVQVRFIVEKDGSLSNIDVINDLGHGTGEAAVNLLKKAPKWEPGTQNGKPVRVAYTVPINLDLSRK